MYIPLALFLFQVVLMLLEEGQQSGSGMLNKNKMEITFSDGFIALGMESLPFLACTNVTALRFPRHHSTLLLSVHKITQKVSGSNPGPGSNFSLENLICKFYKA